MAKVSVWVRQTENGKRGYTKVDPKGTYPEGTSFFLRYGNPQRWERLTEENRVPSLGKSTGVKYALAHARLREVELDFEAEKPVSTKPAVAARWDIDDTIANYLNECAVTLQPKSVSGKKYTLAEWRKVCTKEFLDELDTQDLRRSKYRNYLGGIHICG